MDNKFFKSVENKTGVNMNDVFKLAALCKMPTLKMRIPFEVSLKK